MWIVVALGVLLASGSPAGLSAEEHGDWGTGFYKGFGERPNCTTAGTLYGSVSGVLRHDGHLVAAEHPTTSVEISLRLTPTSCTEGTATMGFLGEGGGVVVGPRGGAWTVGAMLGSGRYVSDGTSTTVVLDNSSWAFCRAPTVLCNPADDETFCEDPTWPCEWGAGPMEFEFEWHSYSELENWWQVDGTWTKGSPPITAPTP